GGVCRSTVSSGFRRRPHRHQKPPGRPIPTASRDVVLTHGVTPGEGACSVGGHAMEPRDHGGDFHLQRSKLFYKQTRPPSRYSERFSWTELPAHLGMFWLQLHWLQGP